MNRPIDCGTPELAARFAVRLIQLRLSLATAEQPVRFGVPGGRAAEMVFEGLTRRAPIPIAWQHVRIVFADERAVPPDHADSNYGLLERTLLAAIGESRRPEVFRMKGESDDPEDAAREYESVVSAPLQVLLLGIGEDGHFASLFPGSPLLEERERRVAAVVDSPKPPARRITITPRVVKEADQIIVLATGAGKRDAVARAFAEAGDVQACPARLLQGAIWLLDSDAASSLPPGLVSSPVAPGSGTTTP